VIRYRRLIRPEDFVRSPVGDKPRPSAPTVLFAVLFGINVLNYTDRYVLPAVASDLKADLGLADAQIGLLGTAFLLVYAIAALPAGTIADRFRRTSLVSAGVAFWSLATLLTGLTHSFGQIFAARALLGIGEATYFPPSTSLLADAFPVERRARVMSWSGLATPIGVFLGFGAGGFVAGLLGWRAAFYLTAIPGLLLAFTVSRLVEPPRGASERLRSTDRGESWSTVAWQIVRVRTLLFSILAQALSFFALGGVSFWIPSYLNQHFGMSTASAGIIAGGVIVVAGAIGTVGGGYLADDLLARGAASARLLVPALGYGLAAPAVAFAVLSGSLTGFLAAFFVAAGLLQSYSGPLTALSQDVIVPARRARAVAISLLVSHLLGDAFAPFAIGALSDMLGSLQSALLATPATVVAASAVAFVGCRWVAADRQAVLREARSEIRGGSVT
jgi:predicted MFS family arabinose efflux permease